MPKGLIGLERKRGKAATRPFARAARKVGKAAKASLKLRAGVARGKELKKLRQAVLRKMYGSVITKSERKEVQAMSLKQLQAAMESARGKRLVRASAAVGRATRKKKKRVQYKSAKF